VERRKRRELARKAANKRRENARSKKKGNEEIFKKERKFPE
jgi:hypothetical protein